MSSFIFLFFLLFFLLRSGSKEHLAGSLASLKGPVHNLPTTFWGNIR